SVLPHFKAEVAQALQLISQTPWTDADRVSVLSFSGAGVHTVCSANCNTALTADQVGALTTGGATPLFDAIKAATDLLARRRQPGVWPMIVLFSDGEDTLSNASLRDVLDRVVSSEAQIYAVDLGDPRRTSNGAATLEKLADESGGRRIAMGKGAGQVFSDL